MFHLWTLIPALYTGCRFIFLLPYSQRFKWLIFAGTVLIAEYHLLSRILFGNMFSPELPQPVMILLGVLFGTVVLFAVMLFVRDLFRLFRLLTTIRKPVRPALPWLLLCLSFVLSGAGVWQAVRVPDVRYVDITVPQLPPAFDGYKIVQLTDIHASRLLTRRWVSQVVDKTNKTRPDLILLTGDMADGTVQARRNDVAPLGSLHAPDGVYAVTGNHEYYFDAGSWIPAYTRLGVRFLLNDNVRIHRQKQAFVLAGVTDGVAGQYGEKGPDLRKALHDITSRDTVILMDHRPGAAEKNAVSGVAVQLSGHTHGGMILGLDLAAAPANNGYVSGRYQVGKMTLYVSNGAGLWNGFPLRLGKSAEITLVTLHRKTP